MILAQIGLKNRQKWHFRVKICPQRAFFCLFWAVNVPNMVPYGMASIYGLIECQFGTSQAQKCQKLHFWCPICPKMSIFLPFLSIICAKYGCILTHSYVWTHIRYKFCFVKWFWLKLGWIIDKNVTLGSKFAQKRIFLPLLGIKCAKYGSIWSG